MSRNRDTAKDRARDARRRVYQQAILEAAEALFSERGVDATKMEDIAAEAGLSLRTMYSAIDGGKADIVEEIWRVRLADLRQIAKNALTSNLSPVEKLRVAFLDATEYFLAHADFLQMQIWEGYSWGIGGAVSSRSNAGAFSFREGVGAIEEIVEQGRASGDFAIEQSSLTTHSMVALQQIHLAAWLNQQRTEDLETVFERFWPDAEGLLRRSDATA